LRLTNPTDAAIELAVTLRALDLNSTNAAPDAVARANVIADASQRVSLEPRSSRVIELNESIAERLADRAGAIDVEVRQGDRALLAYFTYFKTGYEPRWKVPSDIPAGPQVAATFNPARNNLQLRVDSYFLPDPSIAKSVHYRVLKQGSESPIATGSIERSQFFFFEKLIDLGGLLPGKYEVVAELLDSANTNIGSKSTAFEKLDEAKSFSAWWKNDIGHTERVIPPFTAITRDASTLNVWGRRYDLNAIGLPRAIDSQGATILQSPARVIVTIAGVEESIPLDTAIEITDTKPWRVTFKGTARGAGLAFDTLGTLEQDGLVKLDLTYKPIDREVTVDALRIEWPLDLRDAEGLLCVGPGGNFAAYTAIVLPKQQGKLWNTLDTGRGGSGMTVGSFYPNVWIGNERRGLLWWADSDQGWFPRDDVAAHEVHRTESAVVLRNNFIGSPVTLDAPRTLTLAYMASPFKPLPKGWRASIYSENGTFHGPHKLRTDPKTGQQIDGWNWINPPSTNPDEWSTLWAEYKKFADEDVRKLQPLDPSKARNHHGSKYVHTSLPLTGYGANTSDAKVANYFSADWGPGLFTPSQRDYTAWLMNRAIREGGIRTFYWDIFYVYSASSLQNGFGYELPDGRIQPTFHGFNLRQFMMRNYALLHDAGLTPGGQVTHATNAYPLIAFPWVDAVLDGEWAEMTDATKGDWLDFYSSERMRVMSHASNFGVSFSWMNLIKIQDRSRWQHVFRGSMDWQRLHDSWRGPDMRRPPEPVLEFGLNAHDVVYTPYWHNRVATCTDANILTSIWQTRDRAILVVFDLNRDRTDDVELTLDLKSLGLTEKQATISATEIGGNIADDLGLTTRDPQVSLKGDQLHIPQLRGRTARYVGLRLTRAADLARVKHDRIPMTDELIDWGAVGPDAQLINDTPMISCDAGEIATIQRSDRIVLAVTNTTDTARDITVRLDLAGLRLRPEEPWTQFVRVRDFGRVDSASRFDIETQILTIPAVAPGQTRLVGVRRY
jgi:hypothetical protein